MTRSVSTLMTIATFALLPLAVVNASAQAKAHVDVPWGFVFQSPLRARRLLRSFAVQITP